MDDTIQQQVLSIKQQLLERGTPPVRIVFSEAGYVKMLKEAKFDRDTYNGRTYMGLPYSVIPGMRGEVGLHCDYEPTRGAVTVKLGFDPTTGHVTVDGKPHGQPINITQIVGSQLPIAQFSDLVQGFVEAHPFETNMTSILSAWLERHGRFE